ncbi:MAG: type IV secretory system conjugative DNA transfer family protein [Lachnospiraceae bacterium]|nr:type IV secretory system conjugative DNA transfer family protein [Lachnospiraceae bacterium]
MNNASNRSSMNDSFRVLGKGVRMSENTRLTRLNNNTLVTGIAGCGKTGSYVVPNLFSTKGSIVVVDTKGLLYKTYGGQLKKRGYKTICLDFVQPERSAPFNPMKMIKRYKKKAFRKAYQVTRENDETLLEAFADECEVETYRQQDLQKIAKLIIPDETDDKERFWPDAAQNVLISLMAYVMEVLPAEEQHLGSVSRLFKKMCSEITERDFEKVSFFAALEDEDPDSFAVKAYYMYAHCFPADKCWASIAQFVANGLMVFDYDENRQMLCRDGIDLAECGRVKTALFVNVSDTDRSMDNIVNLFYSQLFQLLCNEADAKPDGRLDVPVHVILDDFAANVYIPDFDKIVSVIRSREVSVSIMLQSLSQLKSLYSEGQASTIINNCDNMIYMGGQDVETAKFFAEKAGKLPESILQLDLDHEWIFTRGRAAQLLEKVPPYSIGADNDGGVAHS